MGVTKPYNSIGFGCAQDSNIPRDSSIPGIRVYPGTELCSAGTVNCMIAPLAGEDGRASLGGIEP